MNQYARARSGILFTVAVAGWCVFGGTATAQSAGGSPIRIGSQRQVFIDGMFFAEAKNIELVVHPPRKSGEMTIKPEYEWESGGIGPYSSVLYEGDTYHAWYHAMDTVQWDSGHGRGSICYARSRDGIHWEKPVVGLIEYKGNRQNNIVMGHGANGTTLGQDGGMVFLDPNAPPDQKYRMAVRFGVKSERGGMHLFSSGDGIHWKPTHPSVVYATAEDKTHHLDSQNVIFWDDRIHKYVTYVRYNRPKEKGRARTIARGESDHLGGFPPVQEMQVVFQPDENDLMEEGVPMVDFYMSAAVKYPWAANAYYMFPTAYYHYTGMLPEFTRECPANAGPLDSQFAASRDGITWERYDRRPFVRLGMKGEFDWGCARVIWGLVPDKTGREMFLYYRGGDWLHGWDRDERNKRILTEKGLGASGNMAVISRLVSRRDGFVSARAAYSGGEFVTPPLIFEGNRLVVNIDTSATGIARVGILDASGRAIDGFSVEQCDLIHTCNEINRTVSWRGNSDVHALAGRPVKLRFVMRGCDLYAFQFENIARFGVSGQSLSHSE
ncbi:MAG: hypothetical protein ACUVXJ_08680 [Phycisphaerae bacterium]